MKIKAILPIIITCFVLALAYHFIAVAAIDAPHNESNYISCGKCHGQGLLQSPFWGGSMSYDELCQYCHTASSCPVGEFGPQAMTHSSENTSERYGEWSWECRECHDPHYQKQKNYKNTDASTLYLAWGVIQCPEPAETSCPYNSGDNTTTLQYSSITYKTGWDDAVRLTGKTWECRSTILFPDLKRVGYSYPVVAIDGSTITVKGDATSVFTYTAETDFAIMYGQYVKDIINGKAVKFFDQTGTNSYADGIGARNGVCEICHTQTAYFRNDDSGAEHPDYEEVGGAEGTDCIACHGHKVSFGHCFSGGGGGAGCHGTTGSHAVHIETIDCAICHTDPDPDDEITGYPPHVSPGAGYSFTYDDDTNTCSNVRSDALGSCHFNTDAEWGESACTGCHSYAMNNRVNVIAQLEGNSHHIQGPLIEGTHCYECHWEADGSGLITSYHESDTSGSKVDLVQYGAGTRPDTYTLGTTAIQYTADGSRGEIENLNDHCISCHSDQNDTTMPFGDGKTPKEYSWDNSSIDARYSQVGTTTWGKYGEDVELTIINESFEETKAGEDDGYDDEPWTETVDGTNCPPTCYLDPDAAVPGASHPAGAGSQCLKSVSSDASDPQYVAFAKYVNELELDKTFTRFYLYVEDLTIDVDSGKYIGAFLDSAGNNVVILRLYQLTDKLMFNLRLYNNGVYEEYGGNTEIILNTWHKIEVEYDNIHDTWQWWFNGISQDSGTLTGDHFNGIQRWKFGFGHSAQPRTGTMYYDLISVKGQYSGNFTPKGTQTKAYSAHGNATANQGGWDLNETWPDTRNGSYDIACFDCHNSHGSNVDGVTTSYDSTSATHTKGGILKDTQDSKGGYNVNYKPSHGGSDADNDFYNAGAGLCFDCHMNANVGTTPWGYLETFEATATILGYRDTPYFGSSTPSGPQQRFLYKSDDIAPPYKLQSKGGHFGASSELDPLNPPLAEIGGLCTPCHDPHGVSPTLNQEYSVPLLKGTWLTSFYREDRAPANDAVGTMRTDRGKEGAYHIDQNTFSSDIGNTVTGIQEETYDDFAGLCKQCHAKESLTDGVTHDWTSKDRVHESVKGWKTANGTIQHNYPCSKCHAPHNSRLPRLMVTNCLDKRHKGRVENNPAPIIEGSGNGNIHQPGILPAVYDCYGLAIELGFCPYDWVTIPGPDTGAFDGEGGGEFPGRWAGGPLGYHEPWPWYGNSATCHEAVTGSDTDQGWNTKTVWYDDTVTITSGPTAGPFTLVGGTDMQATITWTTDLDSTSYVDFGLTTAYGSTQGNSTRVTDHSITLTNLPENHQTYHYRVRSAGDLGTEAVSGDNTFYLSFPPSVPSLTPEPNTACAVPCDVMLEWTASTDVDGGPIQYYAEAYETETSATHSLDWTNAINWTNTFSPGHWCWKVKARDENHTEAESDWSSEDCFTNASPPSVPVLISEPDFASPSAVTVTFEWLPSISPLGNSIEYQVQVNDSIFFGAPKFESDWISDLQWSVALATERTWYWHVRARDVVYTEAMSGWATTDTFIISSCDPPAPALIDESHLSSGVPVDVELQWNEVTTPDGDDVEYYVQVSDDPDFSVFAESGWISDTSWTVTITDPDKTWYWRVKARDAVHQSAESPWSDTDVFIVSLTIGPPPAPELIDELTNIHTSPPYILDVQVQWNTVTAPDGDPVEYYAEIGQSPTSFSYNSGWISGTSFTQTLWTNRTYYWRVKARDKFHPYAESPWSDIDSFGIWPSEPPPAPALVDELDFSSDVPVDVTLNWNSVIDPDGDPVEYYYQVSAYPTFVFTFASGTTSDTYCTVTLTTATMWYWRVQARDDTGASSPYASDSFTITEIATPPPAPTLTPEDDIVTDIPVDVTLEWEDLIDAPDGDDVEYYVQVTGAASHNSGWLTEAGAFCNGSTCNWTVTLENGASWTWKVQARDAVHTNKLSPWSETDSFTTYSSYPPPTPVLTDEPNIESNVPVAVTFEWEDVDDPDEDDVLYSVQVDDFSNFLTPNYQSGLLTEGEASCDTIICSWTVTVAAGKTWYWRVQAQDDTGVPSPWSNHDTFVISYTYPDEPSAPTLINEPDDVSTVQKDVNLQWIPVTCPDGDPADYYVEVDDDPDFGSPTSSGWILATNWTALNLDPDIMWHWRVMARDSVHTGLESVWSGGDSFKIHLPIINESFEKNIVSDGTGYDDGPWTGYGDVTYTDPDAAIPGTTPPPDAGSECLQSISSDLSDPQYKSFAKINYGSEEPKTFTRMYFYVEAEGLEDGNNKYIGTFQDTSNNDVIRLRLNQNSGQLRLRFSVYNNGAYENYYANIDTSTWYRLEVKYDDTDNTWESRLFDVDGILLDYASGTLTGTHYTGIQKWDLGFMLGSQLYTGIIYYDLFVVNTISYY